MKKKKMNFNAMLMAEDAADVVSALTEGLKEKRLHFQKGDDELLLELDEAVNLSIEAKYKEGKAKVTVEIVWDVPQKADSMPEDEADDFDDDELNTEASKVDAEK